MRDFTGLGAFAAHLVAADAAVVLSLHKGLKTVARAIEKTAKKEIGTYQPEVGYFAAWEELADSTKRDRVRQGFTEDEPLLRTGELRDSISHEVGGLEAVIGSDSDVMVWQELGTKTIPPRAVLGPAAIHNEEKVGKILGGATVRGLLGGELMPAELGYDFEA